MLNQGARCARPRSALASSQFGDSAAFACEHATLFSEPPGYGDKLTSACSGCHMVGISG